VSVKSRIVLLIWLALVASLLVTPPAGAAESFTFTGRGYGHGRGMSQYGAQGAALQGLSAQQILNFYYPGTSTGSVSGQIRVQLSADQDGDTNVASTTGLRVRWLSDGSVTTLTAAKRWRLRASGSQTLVEANAGQGWTGFTSRAGNAEFVADGPISLRTPSGDRSYRGSLRQIAGGTVNVLGLDLYLQGVVAREMPSSWRPAALQAQSIAARTYAVRLRQLYSSRSYDICDTTSCQVYGGVTNEVASTNSAIAATSGQIRTFQGSPALTQYSSSNGGFSVYGGVPYLPAQADPYDGFSGNPVHTWTKVVSGNTLSTAFPGIGDITSISVTSRVGGGKWGGRAAKVLVRGTKGATTVTGATVRSRLGLRSDWFALVGGATGQSVAATKIMNAYQARGGKRKFGKAKGPVRYVGAGAFRAFGKARIHWTPTTGIVVLRGKLLRAHVRRGGPGGVLGFPVTPIRKVGVTRTVTFENGTLVLRKGRVRRVS
jgi:stage II sporulation protein D